MKYAVLNSDNTVIAIHDDNQDVENLYTNCTVYQSTQYYQIGDIFVIPAATYQDLTEFLYQEKCKVAYGGVTVVKNNQHYIFETTQDSITMCNSLALAIANQPDTYAINWKCWCDGMPVMLELNKAQFNAIFAFGIQMINEAFAVQGILNDTVQNMTSLQLADQVYIAQFKQSAIDSFAAMNTVFEISQESSDSSVVTADISDSASSTETQ